MGFLNDDKKDKLNSFVKFVKKELGIEKIPVALHTEANNLGQNIPLDALSLLAEQKRKQITGLLE